MAKKKKNRSQKASQLASSSKSNQQQRLTPYQVKKERYADKHNQRVPEIPKKMSNYELEQFKKQLETMASEANRRIETIQHAGYTSYALDRVIQEGGKDYFDVDSISTTEELIREMTRMRVFMNDNGSTLEGAMLDNAQINAAQYKGKFGNEYNTEEFQFARFDTTIIDKDVASRAFESYRKIESIRSSHIGKKDSFDGGYGSENLIIALYDAEIRGHDSYNYGTDLLDAFVKTKSDDWQAATQNANMITGITGIIEDNITGRYLF